LYFVNFFKKGLVMRELKKIGLMFVAMFCLMGFASAAEVVVPVVKPVPVRYYRPMVTVVQQPVPGYQVIETPKAPFVVRGIFTDRVRVPRGKNLTIVPVQ
jgi:hypothetical protein